MQLTTQLMNKSNDISSRCGKRGCRIVHLPYGAAANNVVGCDFGLFFNIYSLPDGRQPTWKVVQWDIDEVAAEHRKAVG